MRHRNGTKLVIMSLLLAGCSDTRTPSESASPSGGDSTTVKEPQHSAGQSNDGTREVTLEIKDWDQVQQWVTSQRGKVVVIDVWSTSCLICMQEFPHFVDLHREKSDLVSCASLSIDYYGAEGHTPEDVRPQVSKFLRSQDATMVNFISSDPDELVLKQIDVGSIPAALVYDQKGRLAKVFSNMESEYGSEGFSYEHHVRALIERLLTGMPEDRSPTAG